MYHSSGHGKTALIGASEISSLDSYASDPKHPRKIIIVPASGINANTVQELRQAVPDIKEVHLSSSGAVRGSGGEAVMRGIDFGFGDDEIWRMNTAKLKHFWKVIRSLD